MVLWRNQYPPSLNKECATPLKGHCIALFQATSSAVCDFDTFLTHLAWCVREAVNT